MIITLLPKKRFSTNLLRNSNIIKAQEMNFKRHPERWMPHEDQ